MPVCSALLAGPGRFPCTWVGVQGGRPAGKEEGSRYIQAGGIGKPRAAWNGFWGNAAGACMGSPVGALQTPVSLRLPPCILGDAGKG